MGRQKIFGALAMCGTICLSGMPLVVECRYLVIFLTLVRLTQALKLSWFTLG